MHTRDWRIEARDRGHFGIAPVHVDRQEREQAFLRLRETLVQKAERLLLFGWRSSWLEPVPVALRPPWTAALDAAPSAEGRSRSIKQLDRRWLQSDLDELAVVKPWVRWSRLDETGVSRREAASPGEVLLEFSADAAIPALRQGAGAGTWSGYAVTRGAASYFSPSTWRTLRRWGEGDVSCPVLMSLAPKSLAALCFSDGPTIGRIIDGLASELGSEA